VEKIKLGINKKQLDGYGGTLGMPYLLNALKNSDLYDMFYHEEALKVTRWYRATILQCAGKKIYLDLWEYPSPCYSLGVYNYDFDLIIKVQDCHVSTKRVHRYMNRKKMIPKSLEELQVFRDKFCPWTFFPSRLFTKFVGREEELQQEVEIDRLGFFCGKNWKARHKLLPELEKQGIEVIRSDQGLKKTGRPLNDDEYRDYMARSKYGIVLGGRSTVVTDKKNRREIDYMMMKKPLLLNYKPYYYNPLVEGKHYIYIDEDTDLKDLENRYNIKEIAENGYQWYLENATPEGAAKTFRKILKEKLNI